MSAKVEIYTKDYCPYCNKAKMLLEQLGVEATEIDISRDPAKMGEMMSRKPGARTVPQIFIDNVGIGGCDDLYALHSADKLKPLLGL
jgi:glutaredoxin 3